MISGFMSKIRRLGTEGVEVNYSFKKGSCQERKIKAKYPKMRGIDGWMGAGMNRAKKCMCTQINIGEARKVKVTGIFQRKEMFKLSFF